MFARLLPAALFALPAAAQDCVSTGEADNCVRVLACVGDDGLWFDGRAVGWDRGTIAGELSDGSVCTGTWRYTGGITSETFVSCDNGMEAAVLAIAQDLATGTTIGEGRTKGGRRISAWSGKYVMDFLGAGGRPELPCTNAPIPLG
jgi:hypothetical protein